MRTYTHIDIYRVWFKFVTEPQGARTPSHTHPYTHMLAYAHAHIHTTHAHVTHTCAHIHTDTQYWERNGFAY